MIPKRLHYVWVGGPLPDRYRGFVEGWRRLHPGWEVFGWDERTIDFSHPSIADAYRRRQWAKVADIALLMAVQAQGGIYLDTDIELLKPLDPLLGEHCFLAFQGSDRASDLVANGVVAAEPGHWFVGEALRTVLAMRPIPFGFDRPTRYGPKLITRLLRRHGLEHENDEGVRIKDILIHPTPVFFPYPFGGTFTPDCVQKETVAIHHWAQSWNNSVPRPLRLIRDAKRRVERLARRPRPSTEQTKDPSARPLAPAPDSPRPAPAFIPALHVAGADDDSPLIARLRAALGPDACVTASAPATKSRGRWRVQVHGTILDWRAPPTGSAGRAAEGAAADDAVLLDPHGREAIPGRRIWRVVDAAGRPLLASFFARDLCYHPSGLASLFLIETWNGGASWAKLSEAHPSARQPYPSLLRAAGESAVTMVAAALRASAAAGPVAPWSPTPSAGTVAWRGGPLRWRAAHAFRRVYDGLTTEHWGIGVLDAPAERVAAGGRMSPSRWLSGPPRSVGFLADPFPWPGRPGFLLCERFDHRTGRGRLQALPLDTGGLGAAEELPIGGDDHVSYPFTWEEDGRAYCLPEMASQRRQAVFELRSGAPPLEVAVFAEDVAMADPTLFRHGGLLWLAFTDEKLGQHDNLCLMYAERLAGPWTPHRGNPVKVDARSSRPAGGLFRVGADLVRPAQDCSRSYGGAVVLNRVLACTLGEYREEVFATLSPDPRGPYPDGLHSVSFASGLVLVDGKRAAFDLSVVLRRARRRLFRSADSLPSGGHPPLHQGGAAAAVAEDLFHGVPSAAPAGDTAT